MPDPVKSGLGPRLRALREEKGLSLRKVERESGINSGYLSQLERGEIAQPTPSVLQRVARAYGEPLGTLMSWAGYIEEDPAGVSPNAKRALSYLGEDFTEDELRALKAVLDVIRSKGGAASSPLHNYDRALAPTDEREIAAHANAVLREIDARGTPPTNIDDALVVAKLVKAGAITLTLEERRSLRRFFGGLADWALERLRGVMHLESRQVWINPDIRLESKKRFVLAHEIGHAVLPAHIETFAYLDDHKRLRSDIAHLFERQANQFSIELLAQGDALRKEWDDSAPSIDRLDSLSTRYAISLQGTARRVAETSKQPCAVAISFRAFNASGSLSPHHLFVSGPFEQRLRWKAGLCPSDEVRASIVRAAQGEVALPPLLTNDVEGRRVEVRAEGLDAYYAVIVLFACDPAPRRKLARVNPFLRT